MVGRCSDDCQSQQRLNRWLNECLRRNQFHSLLRQMRFCRNRPLFVRAKDTPGYTFVFVWPNIHEKDLKADDDLGDSYTLPPVPGCFASSTSDLLDQYIKIRHCSRASVIVITATTRKETNMMSPENAPALEPFDELGVVC